SQATLDIVQALTQAQAKQGKALFLTMHGRELCAKVYDVVARNALHAVLERVFKPHQGPMLHVLVQRKRQAATPDDAAFVLQHKTRVTGGALAQYVDGKAVLEVDLRRLG